MTTAIETVRRLLALTAYIAEQNYAVQSIEAAPEPEVLFSCRDYSEPSTRFFADLVPTLNEATLDALHLTTMDDPPSVWLNATGTYNGVEIRVSVIANYAEGQFLFDSIPGLAEAQQHARVPFDRELLPQLLVGASALDTEAVSD